MLAGGIANITAQLIAYGYNKQLIDDANKLLDIFEEIQDYMNSQQKKDVSVQAAILLKCLEKCENKT